MPELQELVDFVEQERELRNRELVEIIVFYLTEVKENEFCTISQVRGEFDRINHPVPTRTAKYLSEGTTTKYRQYVKKGHGYALHRQKAANLKELFTDLSGQKKPEINDTILEPSHCTGGRRYLISLVEQINGTYTYGFHDATAVLMRRMMESLLISAFHNKSLEAKIIDVDGNYLMLNGLISQAKNPANFKLSRGMDDVLDAIKDIGDTAAHNRSYITKKADIDNVQSKFRRLVEELCALSGIPTQ